MGAAVLFPNGKGPAMDERHISERAYHLWHKEGCPGGRDAEFWERARSQLEEMAQPAMQTPLGNRTPGEVAVDEGLAETFPASDPPAFVAPARS